MLSRLGSSGDRMRRCVGGSKSSSPSRGKEGKKKVLYVHLKLDYLSFETHNNVVVANWTV